VATTTDPAGIVIDDDALVRVEEEDDCCCCCCWLRIEFIFKGDESALQTTRVIVGACLMGDENEDVDVVLRKSAVFICGVVVEEALLLLLFVVVVVVVVIFGY